MSRLVAANSLQAIKASAENTDPNVATLLQTSADAVPGGVDKTGQVQLNREAIDAAKAVAEKSGRWLFDHLVSTTAAGG